MKNSGLLTGFRTPTVYLLVGIMLIALCWAPVFASGKTRHQFQADVCDPELGIRPREATVTHESDQLRLSLPIRISCDELRRNADLLRVQVIERGKEPTDVTYELDTPPTGLSLLFVPDIASEYLVATRGNWCSSAHYSEVVIDSLLELYNFSGQLPTDEGSIAVPGQGFIIETPVHDENLIHNKLMEALPQLSSPQTPANERLSSYDLLRTWMEREERSALPRGAVVIRWQPEPYSPGDYPLDIANRQGVDMIIVDIVGMDRLDEREPGPTGARLVPCLAPECPAHPRDHEEYLDKYRRQFVDRISELEGHITNLRPTGTLSFTSTILVDSTQLDRGLTKHIRARVFLSEIGGTRYECTVPWRFHIDESSDGRPLVIAAALLASLSLGTLAFIAALSMTAFYPELKKLQFKEGEGQ